MAESTVPCSSTCDVNDAAAECVLLAGHEHEHEASIFIGAGDPDNTETPFLVWWGDDGHAFVGSNRAVNTGNIG
jgi:hypothetical protein